MSELLKNASLKPARKLPTTVNAATHIGAATPPQSRQKEQLALAFSSELEELREEAKSDGYLEGYEAGKADAIDHFAEKQRELEQAHSDKLIELDAALERSTQLLARIEEGYQKAVTDTEPTAVAIAFAALTKLIGQADAYRELLPALVRAAIEQFGDEHALRINVSGADFESLNVSSVLQPWRDRISVDKQLPKGGCLVEAGPRSLDAGLMLQLEALRQCLLATCETRNHVGD